MSTISGKEINFNFNNVKNSIFLNNCDEITKLLYELLHYNNFNIINKIINTNNRSGFHIIFLLTDSNITIYTFPETKNVFISIYTHKLTIDNKLYYNIFTVLLNELNASKTSVYKVIDSYF